MAQPSPVPIPFHQDLDRNCWVLEPEQPRRSDTYRRVSLGKFCSLHLTLEPKANSVGPPDLRFLGADSAVAPLRHKWAALRQAGAGGAPAWDPARTVRENLEEVRHAAETWSDGYKCMLTPLGSGAEPFQREGEESLGGGRGGVDAVET